jgi:hypothetical protein
MPGDKGSGFFLFALEVVASHDHMFVDKNFLSPLLDCGLYLQRLTIGGTTNKSGVDF